MRLHTQLQLVGTPRTLHKSWCSNRLFSLFSFPFYLYKTLQYCSILLPLWGWGITGLLTLSAQLSNSYSAHVDTLLLSPNVDTSYYNWELVGNLWPTNVIKRYPIQVPTKRVSPSELKHWYSWNKHSVSIEAAPFWGAMALFEFYSYWYRYLSERPTERL